MSVHPAPAPLQETSEQRAGVVFCSRSVVSFRPDMVRFAMLQVRNHELAEDLVQESIEAALRKSESFEGQSTLKTWVFTILRNRIIDHLRKADRFVNFSSLTEEGEELEDQLQVLFNEHGRWRPGARPVAWPSPEEALSSQQFWLVFEACLTVLPDRTARVFTMREFLGFDVEEISAQLGLKPNNCHVILHRARLRLRACMSEGWAPTQGTS